MQVKILLITVGVILLALGLLNTVPDILRFVRSNTTPETLMIKNYWVLAVICGVVLCVVGLFIGKRQS
jgi:hypothetical protein